MSRVHGGGSGSFVEPTQYPSPFEMNDDPLLRQLVRAVLLLDLIRQGPSMSLSATLVLGSVRKPHSAWYIGALLGCSLDAQNQSDLLEPFANPRGADDSWFD